MSADIDVKDYPFAQFARRNKKAPQPPKGGGGGENGIFIVEPPYMTALRLYCAICVFCRAVARRGSTFLHGVGVKDFSPVKGQTMICPYKTFGG